MSILLHSCCGPCLGAAAPAVKAENPGQVLALFWENPNIHPYTEYFQRLVSFKKMAACLGLEVFPGKQTYGLAVFIKALGGNIEKPGRCAVCFRIRLSAAAEEARSRNFEAFSTTLLVSPYQDHELLLKVGYEVSRETGIPFAAPDLRPYFKETYAAARRENLYRQKYCGCIFSESERFSNDPRWTLPGF